MQRERRRDPYPWTWEIPVAVALAALFVIVIGIQLGRSVANLLAGAGWTWPARRQRRRVPLTDRHRVLDQPARRARRPRRRRPAHTGTGRPGWPRPGVGQPRDHRGRAADRHHLGRRLGLPAVGPGRMRGMATAAEAEKILGVTRLRKVAGIVRPDLYGKHAAATAAARSAHRRRPRPNRPGRSSATASARGCSDRAAEHERRSDEAEVRPLGRGLAHRRRARAARRRAVGAVGPHRRRHRPAGLRQDPRPAHPGAARRPGRRPGDADQGRGPAAQPHRTLHAATGRAWSSTRSAWPRASSTS